jgi:hypothetical protein
MRLEGLAAGLALNGLEPSAVATVVAVVPIATAAVQVIYKTPVCTENSNPRVVMVKSAQDSVRTYETGSLNRPRIRRIFV